MLKESLSAADEVVEALLKKGLDYSAFRDRIAEEAFDTGLLEGNWDVTVDCEGLQSLRFIQEDEYDQHMDEDEDRPNFDEQVAYVCVVPAYVWVVS